MASALPSLTAAELERVNTADPAYAPFILEHRRRVLARGIPYTINVVGRSRSRQDELHRAQPEIALKVGTSKHELGFAHDFGGPRNADEWTVAGEAAEALGLEWGGRYQGQPERWHVEAPVTRKALAIHRALVLMTLTGAFVVGWAAVRAVEGET